MKTLRERIDGLASALAAHRDHRRGKHHDHWKGSEIQSLLFERSRWTAAEAKAWAKRHDFKSGKVHTTDRYLRLRQFAPIAGTQKRTIVLGDGVHAVIEQVK